MTQPYRDSFVAADWLLRARESSNDRPDENTTRIAVMCVISMEFLFLTLEVWGGGGRGRVRESEHAKETPQAKFHCFCILCLMALFQNEYFY